MSWLGAVRQQVITLANVDPHMCRHMASLGHNKLINWHNLIVQGFESVPIWVWFCPMKILLQTFQHDSALVIHMATALHSIWNWEVYISVINEIFNICTLITIWHIHILWHLCWNVLNIWKLLPKCVTNHYLTVFGYLSVYSQYITLTKTNIESLFVYCLQFIYSFQARLAMWLRNSVQA